MKRFIDWLPLLGGCGFTLFIDLKSQVWFKIMIIITTGCYFVYDFALHGYTAFVFDALTMLTNLFAMFKIMKMDKKIA
ncbi:MAG: YgjV family protein [Clostridia bacterium]|nr:YgjV family protein [Clostridia bacterium]